MIKIDMEMPKVCHRCPLYIEGESGILMYGVRLGGKCKVLPIKDMEGHTVDYQTVIRTGSDVEREVRYPKCPLQEVKECK